MANKYFRITIVAIIFSASFGCQSLGEHYNCMAEVDRLVPAKTQQKYIRTDTKCVKSNEQSYQITGGYTGTVYNPAKGDVNCSSVPIYETVVLNQQERDLAYQQCRAKSTSQYESKPFVPAAYTTGNKNGVQPYTIEDAQRECKKSNPSADSLQNCINVLTKGNATPQPKPELSNLDKNKQNQIELLKRKRNAEDGCISNGFTPGSRAFNQCVNDKLSK